MLDSNSLLSKYLGWYIKVIGQIDFFKFFIILNRLVYISTSSAESGFFVNILTTIYYCFLDGCHSDWCEMVAQCSFYLPFSDVEGFHIYWSLVCHQLRTVYSFH